MQADKGFSKINQSINESILLIICFLIETSFLLLEQSKYLFKIKKVAIIQKVEKQTLTS